jgi:glycine dehydrogenase subunit 1
MERLTAIEGVERVFEGPFFHEAVYRTPKPAAEVLDKLAERGILGGCDLSGDYLEVGEVISVCATEMRSDDEIERYGRELASILLR